MIKTIDSNVSCPGCGFKHCVSVIRVGESFDENNIQLGIICPRCPRVMNKMGGQWIIQSEVAALKRAEREMVVQEEKSIIPIAELATMLSAILVEATNANIDIEDLMVLAVAVSNGTIQMEGRDG